MQTHDPGTVLEDRPLRDLVAQLSRDGSTLVQQEIALAKVELRESADKMKEGVASLATGALVLYAGVLTLIAGAVLLLSEVAPAWLSALLVGAAVSLVGSVLLGQSKKKLQQVKVLPQRTIQNVERDVNMVKEAVR